MADNRCRETCGGPPVARRIWLLGRNLCALLFPGGISAFLKRAYPARSRSLRGSYSGLACTIGTPLVGGAVDRVLAAIEDESGSGGTPPPRTSESLSVRREAWRAIEDRHFELNHEVMASVHHSWRDPLVWAVDAGWTDFERLDAEYAVYLDFCDLEPSAYVSGSVGRWGKRRRPRQPVPHPKLAASRVATHSLIVAPEVI